MIRPIDIRLNAAHPELKLPEAVTYTGAPSTVFIRGVPTNYGHWEITAVFVAATFPDGSTTTRAAVQSANGVWVATLPATATSGRSENGFRIIADGIDENGAVVTGYIIAVADFAVASLAVAPAPEPGETSWQMLYFDTLPGVLRKGDVTKIDGVLKFYNGTAWEAFATSPALDDEVTRTSGNGVKSSGIWAALWGALASTPFSFSSLYDWAKNCFADPAAIAPKFKLGGIAYNKDDLCIEVDTDGVSGLLYQCKKGYQPDSESNYPSSDPEHWEVVDVVTLLAGKMAADATGADIPIEAGATTSIVAALNTVGSTADQARVAAGQALSAINTHAADTTIHVTATEKATWSDKANRADNPTAGNLAALDANGNPTDAGYRLAVRNGIPCIVQTVND